MVFTFNNDSFMLHFLNVTKGFTILFPFPCWSFKINVCFWETAHLPIPKANILPKARSKC